MLEVQRENNTSQGMMLRARVGNYRARGYMQMAINRVSDTIVVKKESADGVGDMRGGCG